MSVTAWDVLGIAETGDARAIKRAYAARLKHTRPDEDAGAFQQLSDAYEWATRYARQRLLECEPVSGDAHATGHAPAAAASPSAAVDDGALPELGRAIDEPAVERPVTHASTDAEAEATQDFDFGRFFHELGEPLRRQDPKHLRAWLESNEALYPIELKWAITPHVFDALARHAAELDPHRGHLEVLQAFFGVDARLRRHPAIAPALDYLEARGWCDASGVPGMRARSPQEAFDALVEQQQSRRVKPIERVLMRELLGPTAWLRRLLILLVPGLPGRLADLFARLAAVCADSAYARLDAEALEFWRKVTDRDGFDWRRLVLPIVRTPLLVVPLVVLFNRLAGQETLPTAAIAVAAVAGGAAFTWTVAVTALRRLVAWNRARWQWHLPLACAIVLFGAACVLALAGSGWWIACVIAIVLLWSQPRSFAGTLFSFVAALMSWGLLFGATRLWLTPGDGEAALTVSVLATAALLVGVDVAVARRQRMAIDTARTSLEGPAWMIGAAIALLIAAETLHGLA